MNVRVALFGVAIVMAMVPGCGKKGAGEQSAAKAATEPDDAGVSLLPERTVVTSVEIKVVDPSRGPARELYPRELAKRVGATLGSSEWFVAQGETPPGVQLRSAVVEVVVGYSVVSEGSTGDPAIIAVVEAAVRFTDGRGGMQPAMNVLAERPFDARHEAALDALVVEHVTHAITDAAEGLIAKERARVGLPAEAIAALDSKDEDVRVWALAVIGNRRFTDAFDAVVSRLQSDHETERDAALGALISLRDPRAVSAITRVAEFQDYELMKRVLDAVSILGGDEAVDYLEFVASGHPDDDIKTLAADALRRLQRRRQRAQKAGAQ